MTYLPIWGDKESLGTFNYLFWHKIKIDLNLRPHNLKQDIYYELTQEYEKL